MTIAAVVVRWRGGEEVARCLRSLVDHGPDRVVLVDSGSGDGGASSLATRFPEVEVIELEENRSFAWAASRGAEAAPDADVLLLNPDTEVMTGAVDRLAATLRHHPEAAGMAPLLVDRDGRPQHRWQLRRLPGVARLALGLPGAPAFPGPAPSAPAPVPQPAAAAWLLRREVWDRLDGLDPAFVPAWWEDVDLCARLAVGLGEPGFPAAAGFVVEPSATVVHSGGGSARRLGSEAFLLVYHRNLIRYAARHHPKALGPIRAGVAAACVVRAATRPGRRRAYLRCAREVVRGSEHRLTARD